MKKLKTLGTLILAVMFTACASLKTAPFDQYSYQKSIEIKIDALRLMDKATESYKIHTTKIEELKDQIEKIVEYEKYKPNNDISFKMWQILSNEEKNLLAGFLSRWKTQEKLSPIFIKEAKLLVEEAMNLLIQYEGRKEVAVKNKLVELISEN